MTIEFAFGIAVILAIGLVAIAAYSPEPSLDDLPESDGEKCVACGSRDLEHPAPGAYTCRGCGFEGGEDRGELERQERELVWSLKPWPERCEAAFADLEDARLLLLGAHGELLLLGQYLDSSDPFRSELDATWKRVALTAVSLFAEDANYGPRRPGDIQEDAHAELQEETEKAWGALRRASVKIPEIDAGPQLPHHRLVRDGASGTGQSMNHVMRGYREMAERYRAAKDLLVALVSERS